MPKLTPKQLQAKASKIKVVLMDVDGVLTSGPIYHFVDTGKELVEFKGIHSVDSIAMVWLAKLGLRTGTISGRISAGVEARLKLLQVSFIYQHRLDKKNVFEEICQKARVLPEETLYIGDDLPDVPVIKRAGIGVAVGNARPEVKAAAHWVTRANGGEGAVREVGEMVLRSQNLWKKILDMYEAGR